MFETLPFLAPGMPSRGIDPDPEPLQALSFRAPGRPSGANDAGGATPGSGPIGVCGGVASKMALVEGVGDEVTAFAALAAALGLLGLAWFSTRTGERGEAALPADADGPPPRREPQPRPEREEEEEEDEEGPAGSPFVLRLKFLNETERLARVRPRDTVGALKRLYFPGQEQLVRLIYQGQLLRDDAQTLAALHLAHNSVVHCHVGQRPRRPTATPSGATDPLPEGEAAGRAARNLGGLMLPLLVLLLAALWYFQLRHRHVFTATATACLTGLTLLFGCGAWAAYRR